MRGFIEEARGRGVALVVATVAILTAGMVHPPAAQAASNGISGLLTVSGAPAQGVQLELLKWGGTEWWYGYGGEGDGITDAAGRFAYGDLAPGTYTVMVHRRYPDGSTTSPAGPGASGTVTIDADDQAVLDVVLPTATRTVTGQVLELDGTPAAHAHVELGAWSADDHPAYLFSTTTDAEGRYVLPVYDDRPHTVTAWMPSYLRTLLGDTTLYWEATTFGLDGGPSLPSLTLQSQRISGIVTKPDGAPAPGRHVALLRWDHAQDVWAEVTTGTTSPTGRYAFRNTGEGHFTVRLDTGRGAVHPTTGFEVPFVSGTADDTSSGPGFRWTNSSSRINDLHLVLPPPAPGVVRLTGTRTVGRSLRAQVGPWGEHYTLRYRWLRDGRPIAGATRSSHRLVTADGRRRISVRVTAVSSYPGLDDQLVTSAASRVRAQSRLTLRAEGERRSARLVVRLRLPGTKPARTTQRITVHVDGERRTTVRLRGGGATATLRGLASGRHRVLVRFAGTSHYTPARAQRMVRVS